MGQTLTSDRNQNQNRLNNVLMRSHFVILKLDGMSELIDLRCQFSCYVKLDKSNVSWNAVTTISGDRKLIKTVESSLEDFETRQEGGKQRRNLSYATEALMLWFEKTPDVYVSGNLFIRYEENGAEKRSRLISLSYLELAKKIE